MKYQPGYWSSLVVHNPPVGRRWRDGLFNSHLEFLKKPTLVKTHWKRTKNKVHFFSQKRLKHKKSPLQQPAARCQPLWKLIHWKSWIPGQICPSHRALTNHMPFQNKKVVMWFQDKKVVCCFLKKKKKNKMKPTNPNADTYVEKQRFTVL